MSHTHTEYELLDELRGEAAATTSTESVNSEAAMEVTNYLTMRLNKILGDVLDFWETHKSMFPILSQLAVLYLSMSASSVGVESMFSTTGLISNGKRSMLSSDKLNRISFIHDNCKFLDLDT